MSDLISRQAAIAHAVPLNLFGREVMMVSVSELENLPSAQPKRGRWHYSDGKPARIGLSFGVVCDQCGTESEYCTNFCGECGADMREVTT